jgi:integrase
MAARAKKVDLTDRFLRSLKRKKHPGKPPLIFIYDGTAPGLNVLWTKTGHLSWGMTKRWPGKKPSPGKTVQPTWRSLGSVYLPPRPPQGEKVPEPEDAKSDTPEEEITAGALTLAEARAKARRWINMLSRDIDPATEARKQRVEAAKRVTWQRFRDAFLTHFKTKKKYDEAVRILHREFEAWEGRFADEIGAGDVETAIQVIVDRGARAQARNSFAYIRSMYGWAKGRPSMRIKVNPCDGIKIETIVGKKKPRTHVLKDYELRAIWNACDQMGYPYGPIIRLLILTGVRENQIARMRRVELIETTEDGQLLVIPSERMKGEEDDPPPPHEVPLTATMAEIIDSLPRFDGPYVFTTTAGAKPVNSWSKAKKKIDELSGVSDWIFHDLRRTARTHVSAIPAEEHVREALVAHGRRGIVAHYDQYKYRTEKRRLLGQWESRLQRIVTPPKTINPPGAIVMDIEAARARLAL